MGCAGVRLGVRSPAQETQQHMLQLGLNWKVVESPDSSLA